MGISAFLVSRALRAMAAILAEHSCCHTGASMLPKANLENVIAEWQFKVTMATLSPRWYSPFVSFKNDETQKIELASDVGIFFRTGGYHPLAPIVQDAITTITGVGKQLAVILIIIAILLGIVALRTIFRP